MAREGWWEEQKRSPASCSRSRTHQPLPFTLFPRWQQSWNTPRPKKKKSWILPGDWSCWQLYFDPEESHKYLGWKLWNLHHRRQSKNNPGSWWHHGIAWSNYPWSPSSLNASIYYTCLVAALWPFMTHSETISHFHCIPFAEVVTSLPRFQRRQTELPLTLRTEVSE